MEGLEGWGAGSFGGISPLRYGGRLVARAANIARLCW